MANIKKFEDLSVWQDARALTRSMFSSKRKTSDFIIIDVYNDDSVGFRLIHLNGEDINSLGKLEDYINPN